MYEYELDKERVKKELSGIDALFLICSAGAPSSKEEYSTDNPKLCAEIELDGIALEMIERKAGALNKKFIKLKKRRKCSKCKQEVV